MIIEKNRDLLIIPPKMLKRINGDKRRRIEIIITDPRSRHIILTRYSTKIKIWYHFTIERGLDFIPTTILEKAKMKSKFFNLTIKNGDLIIKRHNIRRINV